MADPFRRMANVAGASGGTPATTTIPTNVNSPVNFTAARQDITDAMAGRITLAMLDLIVLGLIGFYVWTKTAQGGS